MCRSKEPLIFFTGLRTFTAGAIFSQHTVGNKHKFERYFQPGQTVIASVFAPIHFPPVPVLVFRKSADNDSLRLVATGQLASVNPDRMIVKRIRLTGSFVRALSRLRMYVRKRESCILTIPALPTNRTRLQDQPTHSRDPVHVLQYTGY